MDIKGILLEVFLKGINDFPVMLEEEPFCFMEPAYNKIDHTIIKVYYASTALLYNPLFHIMSTSQRVCKKLFLEGYKQYVKCTFIQKYYNPHNDIIAKAEHIRTHVIMRVLIKYGHGEHVSTANYAYSVDDKMFLWSGEEHISSTSAYEFMAEIHEQQIKINTEK